MKKYMFFLSVPIVVGLSACATVQGYDDYLEEWIGQSESVLVEKWGAPMKIQDLGGGRQLFIYMKQKTVMEDDMDPVDINFGNYSLYNPENNEMQSQTIYYCETTFTTENDMIVDYSWAGNACDR